MPTKVRVHLILIAMLYLTVQSSSAENCTLNKALRNIFLSKSFNSSDSQWIFDSARESYYLLRDVEKSKDLRFKVNFVKNYGNFLLQMFKNLRANRLSAYDIFSTEKSFLQDFRPNDVSPTVNITELGKAIEEVEFAAEIHLNSYFNHTESAYTAYEVLTMNTADYDKFVNETLRAENSEIGYFFLEIFATLLGFSWGLISTIAHALEFSSETSKEILI